jgi:ribosomal protein S18 acetylase RimI-like enzyme
MTCSCGPVPARAAWAAPLLAAEARAAADGKVRMDLTTARSNHAAQALYESLGWVRDEVFLAYARRIG